VGHHRRQQVVDLVGPDQLRRRLQGVEPGVVQGVGDRAHLFHRHAVDLAHLRHQQVDERPVRQLDHQLVHRLAAVPLEDVDADDVAPDGADPAGDLPEGAGPVGQPHADHEGLHDAAP
jgi:hypothetical protein